MFNPLNNWEYMLLLLKLFLIFQKFVKDMCCSQFKTKINNK